MGILPRNATLTSAVQKRRGWLQYFRGTYDPAECTVAVLPGGHRSRLLDDLARHNALVAVPAGDGELPIGAVVDLIDLDL